MPVTYKRKRSSSRGRPLYGNPRLNRKRRTLRRYKRPKRGSKPLIRLIKRVQMSNIETKHKTITASVQDIKHNTLYSYPVHYNTSLLWPLQGDADSERDGDTIYGLGIKLTGMFHLAHDRKNTQIKCWWVPYNSVQGNPTAYADFFHNVSGTTILDDVQVKRWPGIRYLGTMRNRARDVNEAAQVSIPFKFWIPLRREIAFCSDASRVVSNMAENGVLVYTAYDTFQAIVTDTLVVRAQFHATLYWKDP